MNDQPLAALLALLGAPNGAPVLLHALDVLDWGQTLVLRGTAGGQPFTLRYEDCRELRWRVYVSQSSAVTALVSFAAGRDQQRSPAQFLTEHFGLTLYYGRVTVMMEARGDAADD